MFKKTNRFHCKNLFQSYEMLTFPSTYVLYNQLFVKNKHKKLLSLITQMQYHKISVILKIPKHKTSFIKCCQILQRTAGRAQSWYWLQAGILVMS